MLIPSDVSADAALAWRLGVKNRELVFDFCGRAPTAHVKVSWAIGKSHRGRPPRCWQIEICPLAIVRSEEQRAACRSAKRRIESRLPVSSRKRETIEGRMRVDLLIIAVAAVLFAGTAVAHTTQPGAGKGALRGACSAEAQKFCANTPRGKGQLRSCLQEHPSRAL